jgi:hypothetical protein
MVSINQNLQQVNPAAFLQTDSTWLQLQGAFIAQLPGLQNIALDVKFRQQRCYIDQHISYQGIRSSQNFSYLSNFGLALDPSLKIGVGLGFQTLVQDSYYSNNWSALAKLGLQYRQDAKQLYGFSFELNTKLQQSVFTFAYANQIGPELLCFAHLIWVQSLSPQLCFGFEQQMDVYRIRFFAAVQPQRYGFVMEKQSARHSAWALGLQWQNKLGIGLFWNLQLANK